MSCDDHDTNTILDAKYVVVSVIPSDLYLPLHGSVIKLEVRQLTPAHILPTTVRIFVELWP